MMNTIWRGGAVGSAGMIAIALCVALAGCNKQEDRVEILSLEGRVEKIRSQNDGTGEISILYYSNKHKQEMIGTGLITRETEIMINGAAATVKDIREGEQVRGEVRIEKKGGRKKQVAIKIYVDRPKIVTPGTP